MGRSWGLGVGLSLLARHGFFRLADAQPTKCIKIPETSPCVPQRAMAQSPQRHTNLSTVNPRPDNSTLKAPAIRPVSSRPRTCHCRHFSRPGRPQRSHCHHFSRPGRSWKGHCRHFSRFGRSQRSHCRHFARPARSWKSHCHHFCRPARSCARSRARSWKKRCHDFFGSQPGHTQKCHWRFCSCARCRLRCGLWASALAVGLLKGFRV